jgi:hypothetical protein
VVAAVRPSLEALPRVRPSLVALPRVGPYLEALPRVRPSLEALPRVRPSLVALPRVRPSLVVLPRVRPSLEALPRVRPSLVVPQVGPSHRDAVALFSHAGRWGRGKRSSLVRMTCVPLTRNSLHTTHESDAREIHIQLQDSKVSGETHSKGAAVLVRGDLPYQEDPCQAARDQGDTPVVPLAHQGLASRVAVDPGEERWEERGERGGEEKEGKEEARLRFTALSSAAAAA